MNKNLLCTIIILLIGSTFAQNWCPPGAKWHIRRGGSIGDGITGTDGVIEMTYTANTTVAGIPCKRLDAVFKGNRLLGVGGGFNITEIYHTYYTYSNNNVVFLYNESSAFDTLVNFNAVPGDKWLKPRSAQTSCLSRPILTVIDTSHVTINGFFLKQIKTSDTAAVVGYTSTGQNTYSYTYKYPQIAIYIERICFPNSFLSQNLFPTACEYNAGASDGPPSNVFRCYEDSVFPLYKNDDPSFDWSGKPCDYTTGIESIEKNNVNLTLYPNPNTGSFEIDLQQPTDIRIINMLGETVYAANFIESGKVTIEAQHIVPGAYTLKAKTAEGDGQMKFIRQ